VPEPNDSLDQMLLQREAGVVRTDRDTHSMRL
jgi:hypothetical protein